MNLAAQISHNTISSLTAKATSISALDAHKRWQTINTFAPLKICKNEKNNNKKKKNPLYNGFC